MIDVSSAFLHMGAMRYLGRSLINMPAMAQDGLLPSSS